MDLLHESTNAFTLLKDANTDLRASLPTNTRAPALMIAYHLWALSHGIASLFFVVVPMLNPSPHVDFKNSC